MIPHLLPLLFVLMYTPLPLSSSPLPSCTPGDGDCISEESWYGNIQYLVNISAIGALTCLLIFVFLKLRSDHRRVPGPTAIASKLLAVWHATSREISHHCGADAAQFLLIEGGSSGILLVLAFLAVAILLPLNIYAGSAPISDEFSKTTINHIVYGSPLLWVHFLFAVVLVFLVHYGINDMERRLRTTKFRDGNGNPSEPRANSSAVFTVMVSGVPKSLGFDKTPLVEYFQQRYPGKIYKVVLPMDLCSLDNLATELVKVRENVSKLVSKLENAELVEEGNDAEDTAERRGFRDALRSICSRIKDLWERIVDEVGLSDDQKLRKFQELRADLEMEMAAYKEGRARGAGVAFVVFKDVYSANKAVKDLREEKRRRIGRFFSLTELQLQRNQWKVERAPLASDIYWNHLGSSKLSLKLRRVLVNTCLVLMLLFFSSPLAVISAIQSAVRIINAEAIDKAQMWLTWLQSSSWIVSIIFQFLPNVIIFLSMYVVIPSALSYLSKFEQHLTVSREQRAALLKMVWFFLVNLILLKALVESSLEGVILKMSRCYLDGEDCKRIEQYMSTSFLSRSCLSALAFLITSTFLGISFDLLAPVPWIKKKLQRFGKNDMLQLVPERVEDYPENLQRPLIPEDVATGYDLSEYPPVTSRTSPVPKQVFDFAQYYAFNLTIFALTLIYSTFSPLVVPVGGVYFGYRYLVDKYNFLFVYRIGGIRGGNDGRLMDSVLSMMRICVDLFLVSMLIFFSLHGDSDKLQAIFTVGLFVVYKLLPAESEEDAVQNQNQGVENVVVNGSLDYEVFSRPTFEWDTWDS
ncbi:hypothetical protein M569_09624 [Genlisea aurea]|uniref:CSC1-like protein At4g35870 n=1 Tax=Genlisea aurea TaxID=192259 RepID=S8DPX0_9LAMI|nr:hypothetical protein M569_09624 [Genlisea aurea]